MNRHRNERHGRCGFGWMLGVMTAALVVVGCLPQDESILEETSAPRTDCDGTWPVGPQMVSDPDFSKFVSGLGLRSSVQVASGGAKVSTVRPEAVDLSLELCLPGAEGLDGLLPVATDIASALTRHPLGTRTATLAIARVGPNTQRRIEVRDPHFGSRPRDSQYEPTFWEVTMD